MVLLPKTPLSALCVGAELTHEYFGRNRSFEEGLVPDTTATGAFLSEKQAINEENSSSLIAGGGAPSPLSINAENK